MNEELIRDIVSIDANKQVQQLTADLDTNNKQLQDNIISAKMLNDILAQSKGFGEFNKNAAAAAKSQEQLAKLTAVRQLAEEKLAAAQFANQAKADKAAATAAVSAQKAIDLANAKTAALEAQTKTIISNSQAEIDAANASSRGNGGGRVAESGNSELIRLLNEQMAAGTITTAEYNAELARLNSLQTQSATVTKQAVVQRKLSNIELAQEKLNTQQNALAVTNYAKELNAAKGSLDQRAAALLRLKTTYKALSEEERASPFGQRLAKTIPQLNDQVLTLEKSIGNSQRNVGNYTSALGKIGNGASKAYGFVRKLAYILPGVGIAGIIGFALDPIIAYVSQLDIFKTKIESLVKVRETLSDANLKGAQDAQAEIVQLKALYDTAQNLTLSSTQRYAAAKKLQDQYPDTFKNYSIEQIELGKVDSAYLKLTQSIIATARAKASEAKIAENSSRQLGNDERILDERIKNETLKQQIAAVSNKIGSIRDKGPTNSNTGVNNDVLSAQNRLNDLKNQQAASDKIILGYATDTEILNKRNLALTENIVTQQKKGGDIVDTKTGKTAKTKVNTDGIDEQKAQVEAAKNTQDAIAKDETKSLDERYAALKNFVNLSEQLNQLDAQKKIKSGKSVSVANAELNTQNEKLENDASKRKLAIEDKAQKTLTDLLKKAAKDNLDIENKKNDEVLESQKTVLDNIEIARQKSQLDLANEYAKGLKTKEQFSLESVNIDRAAAKETLETQLDSLEHIITNEEKFAQTDDTLNKKLAKDKQDLAALRIKLSKSETDIAIEGIEKQKAAEKDLSDLKKKLAKEVFDLAVKIGDGIFDSQSARVDQEQKLADTKKNADIKAVTDSIKTDQEKADAIAVINAKADAKTFALDEKKKQIAVEKARFDKAASIARIIAETAVAEVQALSYLSNPFTAPFYPAIAATIAAIGAVQIASVLATPIPKYKDGKNKNNNYSGPAFVGDGGMSELVIEKNGSMWVTPNTPTLTNVSADTQVISGPEFKRMLAKPQIAGSQNNGGIDLSPLMSKVDKQTNAIVKAFGSQSINSTILTEKGLQTHKTKLDRLNEHIRRNFN